MKKLLTLALILLFASSCSFPEQEQAFDASEATPVKAQATMSLEANSQQLPVESDTIFPTDSIILQGNFLPNRYIKTTAHWWTIDENYITDENYVRWGFEESGKHEAIFWVKDQFGDIMSDTIHIWVNRAPRLDSLVSPGNHTWGIPANKNGLRFSWYAEDNDPDAKLSHRFRLWRKSCGDFVTDSLIVDTTLAQPGYTHWKNLTPLCRYSWQVQVKDEFQIESPTLYTWNFFTKGTDSLGALALTPASDNIQVNLLRLGDSEILKTGISNKALIFAHLPAGEYRIILSDTLHQGYESQTLRFSLAAGEYLDLGVFALQDKSAPSIICLPCSQDTIVNGSELDFIANDYGCGLDSSKIETTLDGLPMNWIFSKDTIHVNSPTFQLIPRAHPLQIKAMDNCGNLEIYTFYLREES